MGEIKKTLAKNSSLSPRMFRNRVVTEWCEDVHIHFRNLRFELDEGGFLQFASAMSMAQNRLWKWVSAPEVRIIPISDIDPYDEGHVRSENDYGFYCRSESETLDHIKGVEFWLKKLSQGGCVPPILVRQELEGIKRYKRMDGFKRFTAVELFGLREIPCIVDDYAVPGGQENIEWAADGKSFKTFLDKTINKPSESRGERFEILSEYTLENNVPFNARTQIELQVDGNIHLHYNNCRFEFRFLEYLKFSAQVLKSIIKLPFCLCAYKFLYFDLFRAFSEYIFFNHKKTFDIVHPLYVKIKKKLIV